MASELEVGGLTVSGSGHDAATISVTNAGSNNARLLLNSGHGNWSVCNSDTIGDALEFRDESAGATRLSINSTGAVDISGAASGSAALTVGNSTGGTDLEITPTENASITLNASEGATARDLILATGGTPRLTVASTGYTLSLIHI